MIKTIRNLFIALFVIISSLSFAQQDEGKDVEEVEESIKEDKIKTGWNFGALPVISFDSDLGLQLGALTNLYHYGDGSRYPTYDHSLYLEGSWFLKGSGIFRFYYDSDRLIKGIRTSLDGGRGERLGPQRICRASGGRRARHSLGSGPHRDSAG